MEKRIGIIIHSGAALFSNGITQNAFYIFECLSLCGYTCEFLCHEKDPKRFAYDELELRSLSDEHFPYNEYLLIIGVTKGLYLSQYLKFKEMRIPVVSFVCGNHFMIDMENFVNSKHANAPFIREKTFDVIWIIPSFYYSAAYLETLTYAPVFEIPHLWSKKLLEFRAFKLSKVEPSALYFQKKVYKKFDIIILEPNMNVVKNAFLGLLTAEYIYKRFPNVINRVYLTNAHKTATCKQLLDTLTVPVFVETSYKEIDQVLLTVNSSENMPIFICNQLYHSLNYLYYECLHYGFPLVHNSKDLDGCGYFYPGHDIDLCADAVMKAFKMHTLRRESYIKENMKYLERVNPYSIEMHGLWKQAVRSVIEN